MLEAQLSSKDFYFTASSGVFCAKATNMKGFLTTELLRGDMATRFAAYKTAIESNIMQIDEVRYKEDLPPIGFNYIKLGLQDVLLDPKTGTIYTPNTNQTAEIGELTSKQVGGIMSEERFNPNHDDMGRFSSGGGTSTNSGKAVKAGDKQTAASGAVSGALNQYSEAAKKHAKQYYEAVRHMTTDCKRIAENTGYSEDEIKSIKDFIFMEKHDLGGKESEYFAPNFAMAQSWQRLIDGANIQPHDLTLIKHEIMEKELMKNGYSQHEAHIITSKKYNYKEEAGQYYGET